MSENLRDYTKTLYAMDGVVRRVPADSWDEPSPNEDWSAKETLGHVIWGLRRITTAINDEDPPAEQAEADVAGDDPATSWGEALDDVLDALDQRGVLSKVIDTPFGSMSVDDAIGTFFVDPLTHAWDIAKAADIEPALPDKLTKRAIAMLSVAGDALRRPGGLGPAIEVADDASDTDKFVAISGRQP